MTRRTRGEAVQARRCSGPQPGPTLEPFKVPHSNSTNVTSWKSSRDTNDDTTLICVVHGLGNDERVLFCQLRAYVLAGAIIGAVPAVTSLPSKNRRIHAYLNDWGKWIMVFAAGAPRIPLRLYLPAMLDSIFQASGSSL